MKRLIFLFGFWIVCPQVWGADVNGYTALYECKSGGANCNVDVVTYTTTACAQTITTADSEATIESKLNTGSSPICATNGDYSAKGIIDITASGTSGAYRVMRYTRAGDNDDEPWNQSAANQAKFQRLRLNGADFWIIHRLTIARGNSDGVAIEFVGTVNTDNNIVNRVDVSGGGVVVEINSGADSNTVQNSVIHDAWLAVLADTDCVAIGNSSDNHIVNNEIYNCPSHSIYNPGNAPTERTVLENNDVYTSQSLYTDCSGNFTPSDPNSPCAASEAGLSLKATTSSTNIYQVIHNRFWGTRSTDTDVCCISGSGGQIISISDQGAGQSVAKYLLFQNNIVFDGPVAIQSPHSDVTTFNNSIIGNIVWKIYNRQTPGNGQTVELLNGDQYEFYLNTFVDAERWGGFSGTDSDVKCNVFIATGTRVDSAGSGTQVDNNVFYGVTSYTTGANNVSKTMSTRANSTAYTAGVIMRTTATPPADGTAGDFLWVALNSGTSAGSSPTFCTRLNCQTKDNEIWWKAIRSPYVFKRKLRTVAAGETVYIPYARAKNDSDLPEFNSCPSNFADRSGIGIHDLTGFSNFSPDIRGVAR